MLVEKNDDQLIRAILSSGVRIPPMPEVLHGLRALLSDPDAGPRELAGLVARDGALCGALFRLVASPVFGLRTRVDKVEKAITLLGMRNASAVVRCESLRGAFHDPAHGQAMEALWGRGSAVADFSVLALKTGHVRGIAPDLAFTLGMFHDCGLALLCKRTPAYAQALSRPGSWPDIAALDRDNQTDHAMIGQSVARNWLLPEDIVAAIRIHHQVAPEDIPEPVARLCCLLNFACHLRNKRTQADDSEWENGWRAKTARHLELGDDDLADWEVSVETLAA
ncbi:MAG TPA: HDOD domain-containing protein [Thiobacillaceae bacterium]|nr:HDOD domain-containing protein [Thiobacillaceae bacterium]